MFEGLYFWKLYRDCLKLFLDDYFNPLIPELSAKCTLWKIQILIGHLSLRWSWPTTSCDIWFSQHHTALELKYSFGGKGLGLINWYRGLQLYCEYTCHKVSIPCMYCKYHTHFGVVGGINFCLMCKALWLFRCLCTHKNILGRSRGRRTNTKSYNVAGSINSRMGYDITNWDHITSSTCRTSGSSECGWLWWKIYCFCFWWPDHQSVEYFNVWICENPEWTQTRDRMPAV